MKSSVLTSAFIWHLSIQFIFHLSLAVESSENQPDNCIFRLDGSLVDCSANVEDVERFNNRQFFPILQQLLQRNYFRYYKVQNKSRQC